MAAVLVFVLVPAVNSSNVADGADVVVYGATPAGIAAAVSATRQGSSVMLIEQHSSVGGMTAGGLGWDDVDCPYCPTESAIPAATVPSRSVYGDSLYSHFAAKVMAHYALVSATALELSMNGTRHEPHVAEQIFISMLKEANVTVLTGWRLSSVSVKDGIVASLTVKPAEREGTAKVVAGRAFVDGTYEGDLLEKAGLPYTIGREDRAKYGELNAGVVFQDNVAHHFLRGSTGEASRAVPAMTWRLCFSTAPTRKLMTAPPENYNRSVYLGYLADVAAKRIESVWNAWSHLRALPPDGSKFDINCNPRPLGFIWAGGRKDEYINATYVRRKELLVELRDITLGLLWFQQHDDAVPAVQRYGQTRAQARFVLLPSIDFVVSIVHDFIGCTIGHFTFGLAYFWVSAGRCTRSMASVLTSFTTMATFHLNYTFAKPGVSLDVLGSRSSLLCPSYPQVGRR